MSRFGKGALLMILSALGFSAMQIAIAKTAQGIPLFEQLFFRNLFACIAAFVSLRRKNLAAFGKRENRGLLVFRSAAGYAGMIALFYASGHAAQGDVAIINKMSPFVVTVLACLFLKEKFTAYQGVALGLAFGGALRDAFRICRPKRMPCRRQALNKISGFPFLPSSGMKKSCPVRCCWRWWRKSM